MSDLTKRGLEQRAKLLEDRAREIAHIRNPFEKATAAALVFEDVAAFMRDLAKQVDALTPYLDETEGAL